MANVRTPVFRLSYPSLFKPTGFEGQEPKYSITMLFDDKADLSELKAAAQAAVKEKWGDKIPPKLKSPFRDGDEALDKSGEIRDGYEGCTYVRASSSKPVGVVGPDPTVPLTSEADIFAGCYCQAVVTPFTYDVNGNRGVSFALQAVQLHRKGEPFGSRVDASTAFDAVAVSAEEQGESIFG